MRGQSRFRHKSHSSRIRARTPRAARTDRPPRSTYPTPRPPLFLRKPPRLRLRRRRPGRPRRLRLCGLLESLAAKGLVGQVGPRGVFRLPCPKASRSAARSSPTAADAWNSFPAEAIGVVFLFRGKDNKVLALQSICPHNGGCVSFEAATELLPVPFARRDVRPSGPPPGCEQRQPPRPRRAGRRSPRRRRSLGEV